MHEYDAPIKAIICTHPWQCLYSSVAMSVLIRGNVCTHPWQCLYSSVAMSVLILGNISAHYSSSVICILSFSNIICTHP